MRARVTAATAALLFAALTACGGGSDTAAEPKESVAAEAAPSEEPTAGQVEESLKFGTPSRTTGDGGTGVLEITPDTVVFTKEASGETAANGTFVVITMKDKAVTAVAADEVAPISGGGWKWMAPDGEMIGFDSGNSSMVTMDKYSSADPVQPGGFQWRAQVFDLTPEQAKGGTLIYIDGEEKAHRWEMPSEDTGPSVAEVKEQLAS
jgi:hypothetical protein